MTPKMFLMLSRDLGHGPNVQHDMGKGIKVVKWNVIPPYIGMNYFSHWHFRGTRVEIDGEQYRISEPHITYTNAFPIEKGRVRTLPLGWEYWIPAYQQAQGDN